MNITIFSGGSGSSQLVKGLYEVIGSSHKITHILNLYDDGKSTGVCRRVADVLGPSDMRKVHYLHYKEKYKCNIDQKIKSLYESRYDFGDSEDNFENAKNKILDIIKSYNDKYYDLIFVQLIKEFFNLAEYKNIKDFNDFSIINIIYSMLFRKLGVRQTHLYMSEFLNLDPENFDVLINSDRLYTLGAIAKSLDNKEILLEDESSIVSLDNKDVVIDTVLFQTANGSHIEYEDLNTSVIDELNKTDLIILSSGTQMSSLIPSYLNKDIIECLKNNSHKIIMVMNNVDDKDMIGVDAKNILSKIPEFINDSKILFNKDASDLMKLTDEIKEKYNCFEYSMDCDEKGKHNHIKLVKGIFSIYFNIDLFKSYDHIFIDFDDTIWPRNENLDMLGVVNLSLLNKITEDITPVSILSGNSIESIIDKFWREALWVSPKLNVWADSCCIKHTIGNRINSVEYIHDYSILKDEEIQKILDFINTINIDNSLKCDVRGDVKNNRITCINIKPKVKKDYVDNRHIVVETFKSIINLPEIDVRSVGKTSIEFVRKGITKNDTFEYIMNKQKLKNENVLFIGDELEGNDKSLFDLCKNKIEVKNCSDTNIILMSLIKV